ncbi:lysophospholipid acyltransferase family protein [Desulforudis sp. 1088]|uniref:lysophospholipid acyltransferase family protein n=1 Tax=unclassified Candidatus Desulforudis TaxID=2635950 RepID=UPI003CE54C27
MSDRRPEVRGSPAGSDAGYRLVRFLLSLLFRITGGLVVRGKAQIPLDAPLIVVANHASLADGIVLVAAFPRRVASLSAAYLFERPIAGPLLRWFGAIPVEGGPGAAAGIRKALHLLETGGALMVFPEGGVGPGHRPFEPGWAYLALKAGATVLPVGIRGSGHLLPPGTMRPHRAKVEVAIGQPFTVARTARPRRAEMASLNTMMEKQLWYLCDSVSEHSDKGDRMVKVEK